MSEHLSSETALVPRSSRRLAFLDGLRGIAAVQVVLLHYCAAFLPGVGTQDATRIHYGWEAEWLKPPLFFLVDGTFAVYVFFAISGMVLTLAYRSPDFHSLRAVGQRIVRLGMPMAVALAIGATLIFVLPWAHGRAADLSGSTNWLGALYQTVPTLGEFVHQVLGSGMISGYDGSLVAPQIFDALFSRDSIGRSFDPPLWTLHYEFWGSMLIILLSAARRRLLSRISLVVALLVALLFIRYPLLPFLVGHLFARAWTSDRWPPVPSFRWRLLGAFALAAAAWSCTNPPWPWVTWFWMVSDRLSSANAAHLQAMYGALCAFSSVMLLPLLHRVLEHRAAAWLGRISFGLYLTHFPILFTVSSAVFVLLREPLHYGGAAFAAFAIGVPLSLVVAEIFTRLVDQPAVRLSRLLSRRKLIAHGAPTHAPSVG